MFKKRPLTARRPVVGYEGIYEVSNDGRVFKIKTQGGFNSGRELKLGVDTNGYLKVRLSFQNQRRSYRVHRLVAEAFLKNPENLPQVNHKDCDKQNNHYSNLEWCTHQQNVQHAVENGRYIEGSKQSAAKRSKSVIGTHLVTGEQIEFNSTQEAGRNGFDFSAVASCCRGVRKTHKGYSWRFKE